MTHEFVYIPERLVPLLGRDLLSKLGTQVTFSPTKDPLFEWAQPPITLLSVTPQDEWRLHNLPEGKPNGLNSRERKLTQQFPEVWVEDNLPQGCKTSPTGNRTQTQYNNVSTHLGHARPH